MYVSAATRINNKIKVEIMAKNGLKKKLPFQVFRQKKGRNEKMRKKSEFVDIKVQTCTGVAQTISTLKSVSLTNRTYRHFYMFME